MRLYQASIAAGETEGYLGMAGWHMTGVEGQLPKNEQKAFALVKEAAASGLPRGLYTLGYFYEEGIGIPKDREKAFENYQSAAELRDKRSILRLEEEGRGF
jgi:TPR repeat protein